MLTKITDKIVTLSDYARYSALAVQGGVPLPRVRALRRAANLVHALPWLDVEGQVRIVDVGAHCGEWAWACAKIFQSGKIVSYEPVPEFYQAAAARAREFKNWDVFQLAVGDQRGSVLMDVRGQRSSIRPISGEEFSDWRSGNNAVVRRERVCLVPLDDVLPRQDFERIDLLKIDAEGYEDEILRGARETLARTVQVLIEVRFYPLFKSGSVFIDVHNALTDLHFELHHLKPCKGQCLWADALYVKK